MSNVTETTETPEIGGHSVDMADTYLKVFIALAVLTIIEVGIGYIETSVGKIAILLTLAVAKAGMVAAIFMHVKYEKDPKLIVLFAFIVPLIGAIVLGSVVWADYRPI
ncbi:MAG: cytochrome C oxidase subunit IV family protein [Candidatus Kariarchaeaceae archaeon]|jgi:caa(3)-type oxidase subunit IV